MKPEIVNSNTKIPNFMISKFVKKSITTKK